ncbi:DegT/DnrJ/EryC1/StrS family aminotransferase [Poseidonocella sedimentorum]|uniref:dTDP-4-amino-4,6-dideoxygalactose transaminase n=1 Tax=Poseidonocella sedimentorum TaxID=871652 RepID=A0A1I6CXL4_9RHOB|nr:aminotransferase class I/II-fold pyridoxal phosphate-dependent enzyme [Poseidonocella sedimentorum]SFQ97841.1 dTDP-4-amino-4,6-dideoxygalactose transaminase [Poseidonocella sedimentorum]
MTPSRTPTAEPIPAHARAEVDRLFESGDLFRYADPANAPVARLEEAFAALLGRRYALAVSSCSAALFLSLEALDLPRDARVLIPGFTFAAVPSSVIHARATPVLAEVGADYRLDMDDVERQLRGGVDAVLVSHMRGHISDMDRLTALCEAHQVPLIEDAAHALGASWDGRPAGSMGVIGAFSFQSYKLVNGGEGGMLVTDDPDLFARAVIMSGAYEHTWAQHLADHDVALRAAFTRWQNRLPLFNLRLSNLSAAVIRAQLDDIPRRVAAGRAKYDRLAELLAASPWFNVPQPLAKEIRAPDSMQFNLSGMSPEQIDGFVAEASQRGVSVQVFGRATDNARAFWNWQFLGQTPVLPQTEAMLARACDLRLPPALTLGEITGIARALIEAAKAVCAPAPGRAPAYGT